MQKMQKKNGKKPQHTFLVMIKLKRTRLVNFSHKPYQNLQLKIFYVLIDCQNTKNNLTKIRQMYFNNCSNIIIVKIAFPTDFHLKKSDVS